MSIIIKLSASDAESIHSILQRARDLTGNLVLVPTKILTTPTGLPAYPEAPVGIRIPALTIYVV